MTGTARSGRRLDLGAIGRSLEALAQSAPQGGSAGREPFTPEVVRWMLDGYERLDDIAAMGVDPFAIGGAELLLDLNHRVLCGKDPARRAAFAPHLAATRQRFLEDPRAGAGAFCDWAAAARGGGAERFAAAVFVRIVSEPQLFLEGNQRTATLAAGYVLLEAGLPPLVVTAATRRDYTAIAASARAIERHRWDGFFRSLAVARRLRMFISASRDPAYLTASASERRDRTARGG